MFSIRWLAVFCSVIVVAFIPFSSLAEEPEPENDGIPLVAPKEWRGETISLPPGFAKDMKLKGVEKIRFAPGMFQPDAPDFFSYVLVFRLEAEPELTVETLERELLAYYRGLAAAVGKGKIQTDEFSISVKNSEDDTADTNADTNAANYVAALDWIEPFATSKAQKLNIQLRVWKAEKSDHNWIFMAASPNKDDDPIWKDMHRIRDKFLKGLADQ